MILKDFENFLNESKTSLVQEFLRNLKSNDYLKVTGWWGWSTQQEMLSMSGTNAAWHRSGKFYYIEGEIKEKYGGTPSYFLSSISWFIQLEDKGHYLEVIELDPDGEDRVEEIIKELLPSIGKKYGL